MNKSQRRNDTVSIVWIDDNWKRCRQLANAAKSDRRLRIQTFHPNEVDTLQLPELASTADLLVLDYNLGQLPPKGKKTKPRNLHAPLILGQVREAATRNEPLVNLPVFLVSGHFNQTPAARGGWHYVATNWFDRLLPWDELQRLTNSALASYLHEEAMSYRNLRRTISANDILGVKGIYKLLQCPESSHDILATAIPDHLRWRISQFPEPKPSPRIHRGGSILELSVWLRETLCNIAGPLIPTHYAAYSMGLTVDAWTNKYAKKFISAKYVGPFCNCVPTSDLWWREEIRKIIIERSRPEVASFSLVEHAFSVFNPNKNELSRCEACKQTGVNCVAYISTDESLSEPLPAHIVCSTIDTKYDLSPSYERIRRI